MLTVLTVFILFFIHLAGQSNADYFTWPVYGLWLGLTLWLLWRLPPANPYILLGIGIAGMVVYVDPEWGYRRMYTIIGYTITYYWLSSHRLNLYRPIAIAGAIMSLLVVGGVAPGNPNIVAGFIYLSVPAALAAWIDTRRWYTLILGAVALVRTGCEGSWIAAIVAILVYTRRYWALIPLPVLAGLQAVWHPGSVADRLFMWRSGLADFTWLGRGLGTATYTLPNEIQHYHAHSLPITVGAELGLPGLAFLAWGLWRVVPRLWYNWQGAVMAGLLAWLVIDEVIWFWGAGVLAVWLLVEVMNGSPD